MTATEQWDADLKVITAMRRFGGSFVKCLGEAALRADDDNRRRIRETWPEYWQRYSEVAEKTNPATHTRP